MITPSLPILTHIPETLTRLAGPVGTDVYWQVNCPNANEVGLALIRYNRVVAASTREVDDWLDLDEVSDKVTKMSVEISEWVEFASNLYSRLGVEVHLGELGKESP